ncbi:GTP pyrophosphokinase [Morganella morganii]|uniref:GTP pyrophosphokinase n=1 Tax=Morganella morganii TaxID=582 RepID=UPI000667D803|nr:GTP pyrophosphokinase [Morganella morganii]SSN07509.1 GTP pyrophosphokinase yjbM [Klebsiella pneumoniae]EJD6109609.1 GTP pyrophosphokinase [Morganella morganii]EJG2207265.1 GTP pyrophosphokinase [Morganella morganii]EKU4014224.1 GTP pyrophosphokinase [Morganella morganii]ELA7703233.1 GTP pyrophosphokinase [Morganella morganii]
MSNHEQWVDSVLPSHNRLTESVVTILQNLLKSNNINYLSVNGRTKNKKSILEKIERKNYQSPQDELTDLSGIRVIVYFESDIKKVSNIIESSFKVDKKNSLNQDEKLSTNQLGYRSIHYVCDIGENRECLPEFNGLKDLKFEFQVRTVLQHAWAELAHDSNYKFTDKLPSDIERNLYLYSGMLELIDKGFNELSLKIDDYTKKAKKDIEEGVFHKTLDSINLKEFFLNWANKNSIILLSKNHPDINEIINELSEYGINTIDELNRLIPENYAEKIKSLNIHTNLAGSIRDWMIINSPEKYTTKVKHTWKLEKKDIEEYKEIMNDEQYKQFKNAFKNEINFLLN